MIGQEGGSKIVSRGCVPITGKINTGAKIQNNQNPTSHVFCPFPQPLLFLHFLSLSLPTSSSLPPFPFLSLLLFFPSRNCLAFLVQVRQKEERLGTCKETSAHNFADAQCWISSCSYEMGVWYESFLKYIVSFILKSMQLLSTYFFKLTGEVQHELAASFWVVNWMSAWIAVLL